MTDVLSRLEKSTHLLTPNINLAFFRMKTLIISLLLVSYHVLLYFVHCYLPYYKKEFQLFSFGMVVTSNISLFFLQPW